jgi:hypothetical protein
MTWRDHAACKGVDPRGFIPDGQDPRERRRKEQRLLDQQLGRQTGRHDTDGNHILEPLWTASGAPMTPRILCAGCPANHDCYDHAVANDEKGIWAGTTRQQRNAPPRCKDCGALAARGRTRCPTCQQQADRLRQQRHQQRKRQTAPLHTHWPPQGTVAT